jgi:4-amino-4-deoxy-L-arabinose transferase-like glycosyltransferase
VYDSPFFSILYIDPLMYDEWGMRIAGGQLLSERPFFLDPLYAYFLGAIFAVFGHEYGAVAAVQSLLGATIPPLAYLSARRWFGGTPAAWAGGMATVYLPSIFFGGLLMKPALSMFLVTVALWLLSGALDGAGGRASWPAAGAVLGLACLARGNIIIMLPVLVAWILLRGDPAERPFSALRGPERWIETGTFAMAIALVLALPLAHNYAVGGEWILSTANAGANFYIGNNPDNRSGEYQQLPFIRANPKFEQGDFETEAERRAGRELSDREISRFWFAESWSWIRSDPGAWAGLMWRKLRSFWGAFEIPDSLDYYLYRETAPVLRLPIPGYGLLAPLGLLGALLSLRRRGWPRLLLLFTAAYSLSVVVFFVFSRFRMPLVPALFIFAGFAVTDLYRRWSVAARLRSGFGPAITATTLLLVLFVFVNVPVRAMAGSRSHRLATALGIPTRTEDSSQGLFNLGVAYAGRASEAEDPEPWLRLAEARLRDALALHPPYAKTHVELGKVLARQQRNEEAIAVYEEAARIEPSDYKIHHALGLLHRRMGRLEPAEAAFRAALRITPRHVASATELAELLAETGRVEEAEQLFRHALALVPDHRSAREGLAALQSR